MEAFVSRGKISELKFINNEKRLNLLIFILFFIPGTPKDVLTYLVGLTPMKLRTFLLITSIARIPPPWSPSTIGGQRAGFAELFDGDIVFAITAGVSAIGLVAYNLIMKHRRRARRGTGLLAEKQEADGEECPSAG